MAKPRIFISSTYYDLKHIRSSLDLFVESLGFESILSEKGDIAYTPDTPLDESCYREVSNADIFVLIVGGRYGSEASGNKKKYNHTFFERYDSVTKKEYEEAYHRDIPTYVLIENNVHSEFQTYLKNKDNDKVVYAHVDSVNIFQLIEEILSKPRNNPIHTFEKFAEIESWLREQWAGLFRELLSKMSNQEQLSALASQILDLKEINNTLRKYLEAVMKGISPADSTKLIESEAKRLEELEIKEQISKNKWTNYLRARAGLTLEEIIEAVTKAKSFNDFAKLIGSISKNKDAQQLIKRSLDNILRARTDFNEIRKLLGLKTFRLVRINEEKI